ncbi:MAG: L,D-transpeptidase family protein [Actinomycetota bacterium]
MARVLRRPSASPPRPPEEPPEVGDDALPVAAWPLAKANVAPEDRLPRSKILLWLVAALVAGSGFAVAYERQSAPHLFPGTRIGGVVVGSRSIGEAHGLVGSSVVRPLQTEPVTLRADETIRATAWEMGVRVDVGTVVRDTHARQQSRPFFNRLWQRVFGDEREVELRGEISRPRLDAFVAATAQRIDREKRDATVEIQGNGLKVIPHQVGRRLDQQGTADRIVRGLRTGERDIALPVALSQPELRTDAFAKVIYVRTGANTLDLYVDGAVSRSFRVATGTPGYPTPHGQFEITAKRRNPTWVNPWADWSLTMPAAIGPGPDNPLGTRALNLSASGIRIHGSPDADSIGRPASHGCIRMYMHDAETLFELVELGTPVVIVGG